MNSRTAFRCIVKESLRPYRLKNLYWSNHTTRSSQKQIAKAKNPCMVASSSSKVLGTSRDTTSSVTAKAKTASEKPSIREMSWPRQEKPSSPPPMRVRANLLRSTSSSHLAVSTKTLASPPDDTAATAAAVRWDLRPTSR